MGCYHYANAANAAKAKIEDLKTERKKYVEADKLLATAISSVGAYSKFLGTIGMKFKNIIINGDAFDKGECVSKSLSLTGEISSLGAAKSKIPMALEEIDNEILAQQKIIDNPYVCEYCEKKGGNYLS